MVLARGWVRADPPLVERSAWVGGVDWRCREGWGRALRCSSAVLCGVLVSCDRAFRSASVPLSLLAFVRSQLLE
jgi:hypothetical protein